MPPLKSGVQSRRAACRWHDNGRPAICHCIMQHADSISHPKVEKGNPCCTPMARHFSQVLFRVQCHAFQSTTVTVAAYHRHAEWHVAPAGGTPIASLAGTWHASRMPSGMPSPMSRANGMTPSKGGSQGVVQRANRMPSPHCTETILKSDSLPEGQRDQPCGPSARDAALRHSACQWRCVLPLGFSHHYGLGQVLRPLDRDCILPLGPSHHCGLGHATLIDESLCQLDFLIILDWVMRLCIDIAFCHRRI
jgi:hypothetical protein